MRKLGLLAIALAAAACDKTPPNSWLIVDDAEIAGSDGGRDWCAGGAPPDLFVVGHGPHAGEDGSTRPVRGTFHPVWGQLLLAGDATSLASGFDVELEGACDGTRFRIGSAHVKPSSSEIALGRFGGVLSLHLHFERWAPRAGGAVSGGSGGGGGGEGGGGGDYVYVDTGDTGGGYYVDTSGDGSGATDDGSGATDDGSGSADDGSGATDDGSGATDDGSTDDGSGSVDDGSTDDGSDDPCSDCGDGSYARHKRVRKHARHVKHPLGATPR